MRQWLVGQGINVVAIFLFSLCALLLVGMPYAVLLALVAGGLSFIPTVGPFLGGVVIRACRSVGELHDGVLRPAGLRPRAIPRDASAAIQR